jgi:outer membrane lipoprotein-sorting protein
MFLLLALVFHPLNGQDAKDIVEKSYNKMRGKNSYSQMEMKIVRPSWERTISFKTWTKGTEYSLALITEPAREEGKTYLKRGNDMWSWSPSINRMTKLPPSMMSQGWMGSDYTNDDLINEASIVEDYTHRIAGKDTLRGQACHKIELMPKEDAPVVWGKIMMWISQEDYFELQIHYYDEDGDLMKTHISSEIKTLGGRKIPSKYEIIPEEEENRRTIVEIKEMDFDVDYANHFFSQQNMKKVR